MTMRRLIAGGGWFAWALLLVTPVAAIFFLGSLLAYGQVKGQFEAYRTLPEVTTLAQLNTLPAGEIVLLRGRIAEATPRREADSLAPDLVIYQERPAGGREVRFGEEFPLVFSEFVMELPDGALTITPSQSRERVIQRELHTVPDGDRVRTGFRIGDTVMVQGRWQPGNPPALMEVTGVTGGDKASLFAEWEVAFRRLVWVRNGLGLLTLLGVLALAAAIRRRRKTPLTPETATTEGLTVQRAAKG